MLYNSALLVAYKAIIGNVTIQWASALWIGDIPVQILILLFNLSQVTLLVWASFSLFTKCSICNFHLALLILLWEFKEPGHTKHLTCCLYHDASPMNTSYIYIHHYPCHGNHHFPLRQSMGNHFMRTAFSISCCQNQGYYTPVLMLNVFTGLIQTHFYLSCEAIFADDSQVLQGKG